MHFQSKVIVETITAAIVPRSDGIPFPMKNHFFIYFLLLFFLSRHYACRPLSSLNPLFHLFTLIEVTHLTAKQLYYKVKSVNQNAKKC